MEARLQCSSRGVQFGAGGWRYAELGEEARMLARVDEHSDPLLDRIVRRLRGDAESPAVHSEFKVFYDTVVGHSERPEGAIQQRFQLYRDGVNVGSVHDTQLPDPILDYVQDDAIPHSEFR